MLCLFLPLATWLLIQHLNKQNRIELNYQDNDNDDDDDDHHHHHRCRHLCKELTTLTHIPQLYIKFFGHVVAMCVTAELHFTHTIHLQLQFISVPNCRCITSNGSLPTEIRRTQNTFA